MRNNEKQDIKNIFSSLKQFIDYCEEFLIENKNNHDENYTLWLNIISDYKGNIDDLLYSYSIVIDMYYYWLNEAVIEEKYEEANIIQQSIQFEMENYKELAKDLFQIDIEEEIKLINKIKIK